MSFDTRENKEKIFYFIKNIKNKEFYLNVFDIIKSNQEKFTTNNNGVFFDINKLTSESIEKILNLMQDYQLKSSETEDSVTFTPYTEDIVEKSMDKLGGSAKLNNFEKNIIKKLKSDK
jgi:hypothetical protein